MSALGANADRLAVLGRDEAASCVRRLLTDESGNPTIGTVLKVAAALDYRFELVSNRAHAIPDSPPRPVRPMRCT